MSANQPHPANVESVGFTADLKNPACSFFQNPLHPEQVTPNPAPFYHTNTPDRIYSDTRYHDGFPAGDAKISPSRRLPSVQTNSWNPVSTGPNSHYSHAASQDRTGYPWSSTCSEAHCSSVDENYRGSVSMSAVHSHPDCSYPVAGPGTYPVSNSEHGFVGPSDLPVAVTSFYDTQQLSSQPLPFGSNVHHVSMQNDPCSASFVNAPRIHAPSEHSPRSSIPFRSPSRTQTSGSIPSESLRDPQRSSTTSNSYNACVEHVTSVPSQLHHPASTTGATLSDTHRSIANTSLTTESQPFEGKRIDDQFFSGSSQNGQHGSHYLNPTTNVNDNPYPSTSVNPCYASERVGVARSVGGDNTMNSGHLLPTYTYSSEDRSFPGNRLEPCHYQGDVPRDSAPSATGFGETSIQSHPEFMNPAASHNDSALHFRCATGSQAERFAGNTYKPRASDQYISGGPVLPNAPGYPYYQQSNNHPRFATANIGPEAGYSCGIPQPTHMITHGPVQRPPTGYVNNHLQPIASLPSNTAVSQLGPASRYADAEKCNGMNANDNSLFPPILPKLPGSPSPINSNVTSPRKAKALDREAKNERRRQQRLKKKQEAASIPSSCSLTSPTSPETCPLQSTPESVSSVKKSRSRVRKSSVQPEVSDPASSQSTTVPQADANLQESVVSGDDSVCPGSKTRKRRSSTMPNLPSRVKKIRPKVVHSDKEKSASLETVVNCTAQDEPSSCIVEEPESQTKVVRTRPPRPKKKKPLPTLIRKKRRSAFYGDESESEPDISNKLSSRSSEQKKHTAAAHESTSHDKKRRSERTAGDRKKYTVDLDLNLSEEGSDGSKDDELNPDTMTGMLEDNDFRVVEYVLGRRVTKRVVKKAISPTDAECPPSTTTTTTTAEEEEEEVEVEEFYLKYKGYSYLHCEWHSLDEIDDPRIRPKLRRFELKQSTSVQHEDDEAVLFNPDYVEVERVLDMRIYRDGQLITSNKAERNATAATDDPDEIRKQRKRERERNRAKALREVKLAKLAQSAPPVNNNNQPVLPDEAADSETHTSRDPSETTAGDVDMSPGEELHNSTPHRRCSTSETVESTERTSEHTVVSPDLNTFEDSARVEDSVEPVSPDESTLAEPSADTDIKQSDPPISKSSESESDDNVDRRSPQTVTYYLVKWRSLPYEDATWELAQDVDPAKVKEFLKWRNPPKVVPVARDSNYKIIRPDPSTWRPIEDNRLYKNENRLRDYQLEGVNWLTYCWFHHRNCILADEMGLGKTVQSVAFLLEIEKAGVQGPFLIIVPLSTVANWQRELENWSDLNVVVYHGSSTSRSMIQQYEIFYKRRPSDSAVRHDVYRFHVLVTTFEILMTDIEFFGRIHWAAAVIDEAHRLKNKKCKLSEGLRYLELDHRVLLTGTPLQNNVEELFGLLNFLEPEKFNSSSAFVAEYGDLKTEEQVENLKALLKPMMLRRLKEDVEKSLAPKEETIVEVELTNIQKKYYRAIMERNFTFLCKGSTYANAPNLMNVMMELRKCCNHPFLIKGAEDAILEELRMQQDSDQPLSEEAQTFQALVYASGKLVLIHKLLPKLKADGHKVLIFSQMIRVLDILEDYLIHQRFQFERIDGRIQGPLRQEAIDRFTIDPDKFVFLLCTKAGGLGINLTAADVVIIYDSDWNPQNDLQAQARCHRIGQQKMVKVYRLITRNTYEREMFDRASLKLGLDRAVLQSMGSKEARQAQMSKKEIEELLKKGAYGALMDDDKAGEDFCEEDIDKILQSRSRVVQLEQGEKNSTFSKATFSMSDNRSDIELDDPNFWQKWAKMAGVDESAGTLKDLIMKTPRQRRQTSRYTALPINEPAAAVVVNSPNYDGSEQEDSATAQSSGDENTPSASGSRGRSRRCRKQRRHSRHSALIDQARHNVPFPIPDENNQAGALLSGRIEPLDRADLFRVERCLLTWPWGQWEKGLATVPFKRQLTPVELSYFATAVLAFSLRFMPPSADTRTRTTVITLSRPHVWNLSITEAAKAVFKATSRASRGCRFVDPLHITDPVPSLPVVAPVEQPELQPPLSDAESTSSVEAPPSPSNLPEPAPADMPKLDINDACDSAEPPEGTDVSRSVMNAPVLDSPPAAVATDPQTQLNVAEPDELSGTKADEEAQSVEKTSKTNLSPKSASFDSDYLVPYESFRKHMQRHSPRLFNRVAFLFFLQCEVVGVEQTMDLISGRLTHEDFTELAASLPPMEAIDSEPPTPWWDSCCDKCLLLGILKHGWEKYTLMRIDPSLCFYGRAMARVREMEEKKTEEVSSVASPSTCKLEQDVNDESEHKPALLAEFDEVKGSDSTEEAVQPAAPKKEADDDVDKLEDEHSPSGGEEEANNTIDQAVLDSLLTALVFPAVADLNGRARKIVGFFSRIKTQLEFDANRRVPMEDDEESAGSLLPSNRLLENRTVKWTRREEADFYRVVSSFGVEFTPVPNSPTSTGSSDGTAAPVKRRYRWHNFRQLANITRKSDVSLTEYFQSFYRMCQRVCKRPVTEFAGPASTAATTTTSGSSALGDEVPIEPISEERANRCLSRIDLLARIRNDILPHPQLQERLKLCQRSSENPSWWIPGKHDGELLRAAAKHGLARTDLNMLSDQEFSFHQYITTMRDKGTRDGHAELEIPRRDDGSAVPEVVTGGGGGSSNRNESAPEDGEPDLQPDAQTTTTTGQTTQPSRLDSHGPDDNREVASSPRTPVGESASVDTALQDDAKPVVKTSPLVPTHGIQSDVGEPQLGLKSDGVPIDWPPKYASHLANVWPKDRTIQHRLELVCQAIEANEWPMPRRYMPTPSAILLSDPSRPGDDNTMLSLSSYTGLRHAAVSSSFPLSALTVANNLQSPYELIRAMNSSKRVLKTGRPLDPSHIALNLLKNGSEQLLLASDADNPPASLLSSSSPPRDELSSPIAYVTGSPTSLSRSSETGYKRRPRGSYRTVSSMPSDPPSPTTPLSSRGRGRGRGRGSRGSRALGSRGRANLNSSARLLPDAGEHLITDPSEDATLQSAHDSDEISLSDPSAHRPGSGSRGRKRRVDVLRNSATDLSVGHRLGTASKRERMDSSGTDGTAKLRSPRGSAGGPSFPSSSNSDVWDVRVPVISLVDGSLIYGEQAPKRRVLEQWLEANPNYMPYSVEVEDRIIYNRVSSARGQDTNNMEALAYKHYLNSLIMNATAGLQHSTSNKSTTTSLANPAQLMQLQQQQQLMQAFGAYARHPAYANLLVSALSAWPGAAVGGPSSSDPRGGPASADSRATSTKSGATAREQSPAAVLPSTSSPPPPSLDHKSQPSSPSVDASHNAPSLSSNNSAMAAGMESVLLTAYKQATTNLAYMCNPLAAAAAYSQLMVSSAPAMGSAPSGSDNSGSNTLSDQQQVALASLYANYMLAAKQAQQQQQINLLDQQRQQQQQQQQQIAAIAAAIATACSGSNSVDASTLLSMFAGSQPRTATTATTATTTAAAAMQSSSSSSTSVPTCGSEAVSQPIPLTAAGAAAGGGADSKSQPATGDLSSEPTSPVNFSSSSGRGKSPAPDPEQGTGASADDPGQSVLDLSK